MAYPRMLACALVLVSVGLLSMPSVFADTAVPDYEQARAALMAKMAKDPKAAKFSEADRQVMQQAAEDLARELPDPGIKVGEKAPDFTLPDAFGRTLRLYDRLRQGPVVLVFYRGAWCPFCNLHLRTLYESLPQFRRYGAHLILVTPQKPDKSRQQLKETGYPFEVVSDLDSAVMKAYRLYFELDPALVAVYKKHKLDLEDFNGPGRNVLPVPGTFIIDTEGIVRAMHADTDYKQRMEPAAIVAALARLRRP